MVKKELVDDVLVKISGGELTEDAFSSVDEFVNNCRKLDWSIDEIKGLIIKMWNNGDTKALSTDASQKDLEDILKYIDINY